MLNNDAEIDRWRSEWLSHERTEKTTTFDMRRAFQQQRRLRFRYVMDVVAAVSFIGFSGIVVSRNPSMEVYIWTGVVWVTTLAATAFSIWNWRVLWKTNIKSVSDYVLDYRKRCIATLRAVRFGYVFLAVQFAIGAPWLTWDFYRQRLTSALFAASITLLILFTVGFVILFTHHRRTALQELREAHRLLQLTDS